MIFNRLFRAMVEGHLFLSINKGIGIFFTKFRKGLDLLISIPSIYFFSRKIPVEKDKIIFITFFSAVRIIIKIAGVYSVWQ